jgi:hypothetical protein
VLAPRAPARLPTHSGRHHERTAMSQVTITITGDSAKAANEFRKLVGMEQQLANAAENAGKKSKRGTDEAVGGLASMGQKIKEVAIGVTGGLGLTEAFRAGIEVLKQYDTRLGEVAQKQNSLAESAISLAAMQPKGMEEETVKKASELGVLHGVKPSESVDIVQELQSVGGTLEDGLKMAEESFRLMKLRTEAVDAKAVMSFGHQLGMTPKEASSLIYRGAELSRYEPADFAKAMPVLSEYRESPEFGVAAMSAVSRIKQSGEMETFVRKAAMGLTTENEMTKKLDLNKKLEDAYALAEQLGAEIDPMLVRLDIVREGVKPNKRTGLYDISIMQAAGISEEREAQGLAILLNDYDRLVQELRDIETRNIDSVQQKIEALAKVPMFKAYYDEQEHLAQLELEQAWGPYAESARERDEKLRKQGQALEYNPAFVSQETGKPEGFIGRIVGALQDTRTPEEKNADILGFGGKISFTPTDSSDAGVTLSSAIEENTAATKELISTLRDTKQRTRPVPKPQPNSGIE